MALMRADGDEEDVALTVLDPRQANFPAHGILLGGDGQLPLPGGFRFGSAVVHMFRKGGPLLNVNGKRGGNFTCRMGDSD